MMGTRFLALYAGKTIAGARLVAVSADPSLVADVAVRISREPAAVGDGAIEELERGRRAALRLIAQEAGDDRAV